MIQIFDTIVSLDLLEEYFRCDLAACQGGCCVDGESGAPVEESEIAELETVLPLIWDDLSTESQAIINQQGVVFIDSDGDFVTSIINGKNCVFSYLDADGICRCAIEKAFLEGKTSFYKPVSCHLYPVRVKQYTDFRAVNYHRWEICKAAKICGKNAQLKVFQFLKEPLIRKFGQEWYDCLVQLDKELTASLG